MVFNGAKNTSEAILEAKIDVLKFKPKVEDSSNRLRTVVGKIYKKLEDNADLLLEMNTLRNANYALRRNIDDTSKKIDKLRLDVVRLKKLKLLKMFLLGLLLYCFVLY